MLRLNRCLALLLLGCLLISAVHGQSTNEIDSLLWQLQPLEQSGRLSEALPLVEKLSEAVRARFGEKSAEYAATLRRRGVLLQALSRYKEAEEPLTQARRVATEALGPEHEEVAGVLNDLALLYRVMGSFEKAEPLYQRARAIWEKTFGPDHPAVARVVGNLAALYAIQGRYREAEPLLTGAIAITERTLAPNDPEVGDKLSNLGYFYWTLGRFDEAEPQFKRALEILESAQGSESPKFATVLNNLAALYQDQGRYAEAERFLRRVLDIRVRVQGAEHAEVGEATNNLAWFYQRRGRLAEAEPLQRRALDISEKALGPEHANVGAFLNNLAVLYHSQRRYAEAEPLFKRAITIRQNAQGAEHSDVGQSMYRLARLYHAQKRYAEAGPLHEQALEIRRKALGEDHPDVIESLDGIAEMYEAQGDWTRAVDIARLARDTVIRRTRKAALAENVAASESGRREIAQGHAVFVRLMRGLWALGQQQPARRAALLRESFLAAHWAEQTEAATALAQMSTRQAKGSGRLATLVRERQDLTPRWQSLDKFLYASIAQTTERNIEAERQLRNQLSAIDARIAEIDQTLRNDFANYAALSAPEPLLAEEAKALLKPDEALVQFALTDSETFVWAITKDGERWSRSRLEPKAIADHVAALRCGLDYRGSWTGDNWTRCYSLLNKNYDEAARRAGSPLPFDLARAHELYKALFGEIDDLIKSKQLLIVAPGSLGSLPFHVLVTKRPQKAVPTDLANYRKAAWFGQSNAIGVLPSAASLKALREYAKVSRAKKPYLGVGNPLLDGPDARYKAEAEAARANQSCANLGAPLRIASARGQRAVGDFSSLFRGAWAAGTELRRQLPLPETAEEVCAVARQLGGASMALLGSSSTETRLKELSKTGELADFAIVHFATHGMLSGQMRGAVEPGLILTPPTTDDPASLEKDDGYLAASEIATLILDADWVVLSACNTAGPSGAASEALSGLARAFFYAGARALLVSHWAVESEVTVKLITRAFVEMAARPLVGRAEALRVSMRELIGKGTPAEAHPSRWAPFVMVGENRR